MRKVRFRIPILGMNIAIFGKEQSALWFEPELYGRLIKGHKHPTVNGKRELSLGRLFRKQWATQYAIEAGKLVFLSGRVVTDAGVAFLVDDWDNNATDVTNFNFHANGTGSGGPGTDVPGNVALVTEVGVRVAGSKSQPAANQIQTQATISQDASRNINEHGLFSASTFGTMWDRSTFANIGVVSGDSIQYTYVLTCQPGG